MILGVFGPCSMYDMDVHTYSTVKSERLSEEAASSTIIVSSGLAYGHGLSTSQAGSHISYSLDWL